LPPGSHPHHFSAWSHESPNADTQIQLSTCFPSPLLI
jgi:hypothetical protein